MRENRLVQVGDHAPVFTLKDQSGTPVDMAEVIGKKPIVLYFYPKDDTPGCTMEAQDFSDMMAQFEAANTAVIGVSLLRLQGFSTLQRAQNHMAQGQLPAVEMFEGMFLAIAGALLLTPGFITDSIGFFLLLPPGRQWLARRLIANAKVHIGGFGGPGAGPGAGPGPASGPGSGAGASPHHEPPRRGPGHGHTIEGEYERKD